MNWQSDIVRFQRLSYTNKRILFQGTVSLLKTTKLTLRTYVSDFSLLEVNFGSKSKGYICICTSQLHSTCGVMSLMSI